MLADVRFTEITQVGRRASSFSGHDARVGGRFTAGWDMFLIAEAWSRGCDFEELADGYGAGHGTHGDWSGIRDSTDAAVNRMLERALNHLFPFEERN